MTPAIKPIPTTEARNASRVGINRDGTIRDAAGAPIEISVEDISLSGCMLLIPVPIPEDYVLNIGLPGLGRREGRIVRRDGEKHGVEFLWPLSAAELEDVRSTENLILGSFPQRLDALLMPDPAPPGAPARISGRSVALIAGASAAIWAVLGYAAASLIG